MAKKETANIEMPEPFDLRSEDTVEDQQSKLKSLFPEVFTEGGKIDFDRLKLTLGNVIDIGKERYGMMWPGKADCFKTIQVPSIATLLPVREESLDFDSTENLIIEGDNLEVLKLLQKGYLGKLKFISIDPPYNTGKDFIYPDNFAEGLDNYLAFTGQSSVEGHSFSTNPETAGRFHSNWLRMMYPRLYIARNLLREDGAIFVTIDDNEFCNLRSLMNEIFGEENFVDTLVWQKKVSPSNDSQWFSSDHDYVVVYAKNKDIWRPNRMERNERQKDYYKNPDNDPRGSWNSATYTCNKTKDERPNLFYPIRNPNTGEDVWPKETAVWAYSKEVSQEHLNDNRIWWGKDGHGLPRYKLFLSEARLVVPRSILSYSEVGHTQEATGELQELFQSSVFPSPKPSRLIGRMLELATSQNAGDIVLDFFAGSGTVGQAVMEANADGGNRRFILVQLPEPTEREDFKTIAEITKERVRRVAKKLDEAESETLNLSGKKQDRGFKVFKLNTSNFTTWNSSVPDDEQKLAEQMQLHVDHILPGRSQEDILYELLAKSGFPLTTKIETRRMAGKNVFSIADGAMLICLEDKLTQEVIKAIADEKPQRVICLDAGFENNDQLKANAVQTMRARGVEKFQTV